MNVIYMKIYIMLSSSHASYICKEVSAVETCRDKKSVDHFNFC